MPQNNIEIKPAVWEHYQKEKAHASRTGRYFDAILVIDRSSSSDVYNAELKEAIRHMLKNLKSDKTIISNNVYLTLIVFNHEHKAEIKHKLVKDLTEADLPQIKSEGATNPAPALEEALQIGEDYYNCYREDKLSRAHPVIYYFTDGYCDAGVVKGQSERDEEKQRLYENEYRRVCDKIRERAAEEKVLVVACGFTEAARIDEVKRLTDHVSSINNSKDIEQMDLYFSQLIPMTITAKTTNKLHKRIGNEIDNLINRLFSSSGSNNGE